MRTFLFSLLGTFCPYKYSAWKATIREQVRMLRSVGSVLVLAAPYVDCLDNTCVVPFIPDASLSTFRYMFWTHEPALHKSRSHRGLFFPFSPPSFSMGYESTFYRPSAIHFVFLKQPRASERNRNRVFWHDFLVVRRPQTAGQCHPRSGRNTSTRSEQRDRRTS